MCRHIGSYDKNGNDCSQPKRLQRTALIDHIMSGHHDGKDFVFHREIQTTFRTNDDNKLKMGSLVQIILYQN